MKTEIEIRSTIEADFEPLREAINLVCREKWFLASIDGFSVDQSRSFFEHILKNSLPQTVAVDNGRIVGWCNIIPGVRKGFTHVGRLGMGVLKDYRRKGIGRQLIEACLLLAREKSLGLEKVELEVFSDNQSAICLYESLGFVPEGVKKRARKLEEKYQDIQLMALSLSDKVM